MSSLGMLPIGAQSALSPSALPKRDDPAKVRDAGRQFESLMIGQILHSAHESGGGWLGTPEDASSDSATDFAEQQFAAVMAQSGAFGIAHMVERGLRAPGSPTENSPPAPDSLRLGKLPGNTTLDPKLPAQ